MIHDATISRRELHRIKRNLKDSHNDFNESTYTVGNIYYNIIYSISNSLIYIIYLHMQLQPYHFQLTLCIRESPKRVL